MKGGNDIPTIPKETPMAKGRLESGAGEGVAETAPLLSCICALEGTICGSDVPEAAFPTVGGEGIAGGVSAAGGGGGGGVDGCTAGGGGVWEVCPDGGGCGGVEFGAADGVAAGGFDGGAAGGFDGGGAPGTSVMNPLAGGKLAGTAGFRAAGGAVGRIVGFVAAGGAPGAGDTEGFGCSSSESLLALDWAPGCCCASDSLAELLDSASC